MKHIKNLTIIFLVFIALLFFGCSFLVLKPHIKLGCCNLKEAGYIKNVTDPADYPTQCNLTGETSENLSTSVDINSCDWENMTTCNVTVYYKDGTPLQYKDDKGTPNPLDDTWETDYQMVSICSDRETKCIQSNCTAMVCGPFTYDPTPLPGFGDMVGSTEHMAEGGDEPPVKKQTTAVQLYNTECIFFTMDKKLERVFENAKGSQINIFRFGIGSNFTDYASYKYLFPSSDLYCNINPIEAAVKDRYMNYMISPEEFELEKSGTEPNNPPYEKVINLSFCPAAVESPFLGSKYGNKDQDGNNETLPNYKMLKVVAGDFSYDTIDIKFYLNFLSYSHERALIEGLKGEDPTPVQFECELPIDCYSGYCKKDPTFKNGYFRGICKRADIDEWVPCNCDPSAKKCLGVTTTKDEVGWQATSAEEFNNLVNDYVAGNDYIHITGRSIKVHDMEVNPTTSWCSANGIDWIDRNNKICEIYPDDGELMCGASATTYEHKCTLNADKTAATCVGANSFTCAYGDNKITCTMVKGYSGSCDIAGETATCQEAGTSYGTCSWNWTALTATCGETIFPCFVVQGSTAKCGTPETETATLDCAAPSGSTVQCGLMEGTAAGSVSGNELSATVGHPEIFHNDIVFFSEPKSDAGGNSYVGYTMMAADQFSQTDFYKTCDLSLSDYDTKPFHEYGWSHSTWSGILFDAPEPVPSYLGAHKYVDGAGGCFDDDEQYWFVVPEFILLKTHGDNGTHSKIGQCLYDNGKNMIVSKSFGWCEPCSYLTMAKNTLTGEGVDPKAEGYLRSSPFDDENKQKECLSDSMWGFDCKLDIGFGAGWGDQEEYECNVWKCSILEDFTSDDGDVDYEAFNEYRDYLSDYISEKQSKKSLEEKYLKEGVQPVIDISNESISKDYIDGLFTTSGASIIIATKFNYTEIENAANQLNAIKNEANVSNKLVMFVNSAELQGIINKKEKINKIADPVDSTCPKCLVAIEVDNGPMGSLGGVQRMWRDSRTLFKLFNETNVVDGNINDLSEPLGQKIHEGIDIIAFKFYPSEFTTENASLCDDPELNNILIEKLKEASGYIRWYWKKAPLVSDIKLDPALPCWEREVNASTGEVISNPTYSFLAQVFIKQGALAKTGLLGVLYPDARSFETVTADGYTDAYCDVQKASRNYRADKPITIFTKVYTGENITCAECTPLEVSLNICDMHCMNNITCILPPAANPDKQYKCPKKALPEGCKYCNDTDYNLSCVYNYPNGTTGIVNYNTKDLTEYYPDIIAAVPSPYKCCVNDTAGNYTYTMEVTSGASTAPIIFPTINDPTQDCGITDLSSITSGMCSIPLPIKNYKLKCSIEE